VGNQNNFPTNNEIYSYVVRSRVPTKSVLNYDSLNLHWLFTSGNGVRVKDCDIRQINLLIQCWSLN